AFFVFLKIALVHQTFYNFAHIVLLGARFWDYSVNIFLFFLWLYSFFSIETRFVIITNFRNNIFYFIQSIFIVFRFVIGNAAHFAVRCGAAEFFIVDTFANGGFYQITS